jgi:hypothetical protein
VYNTSISSIYPGVIHLHNVMLMKITGSSPG